MNRTTFPGIVDCDTFLDFHVSDVFKILLAGAFGVEDDMMRISGFSSDRKTTSDKRQKVFVVHQERNICRMKTTQIFIVGDDG